METERRNGFVHRPVLLAEVLNALSPISTGIYVDATLGGGGHAEAILRCAPGCRLVGIDRDPDAIRSAGERLSPFGDRLTLIHGRFSGIYEHLQGAGVASVEGVLADLGVSSPQLDRPERGFSFLNDGPLDMRMDPGAEGDAAELVNGAPVSELSRIFWEYGEERHARRIAKVIGQARAGKSITTTGELAELVARVVPRQHGRLKIHPATRVFQALRIAVNDELGELREGLRGALKCLKPGGKIAIISFHSLEDRIVKWFFRDEAKACDCPPEMPMCTCNKVPTLEVLTRRPLEAGEEELGVNPRSRSAKLRVARKIVV